MLREKVIAYLLLLWVCSIYCQHPATTDALMSTNSTMNNQKSSVVLSPSFYDISTSYSMPLHSSPSDIISKYDSQSAKLTVHHVSVTVPVSMVTVHVNRSSDHVSVTVPVSMVTVHVNRSSAVSPNATTTVHLIITSATFSPNATKTTSNATITPISNSSSIISVISSIHPSIRSSIIVSPSPSPTHTPTPHTTIACGKECKVLRKRLYTAAVFAVLFLIVSLVLGILLYRQHKISKENRDDPSLSRLI